MGNVLTFKKIDKIPEVEEIVNNIMNLNNSMSEADWWIKRYGELLWRARDLNRNKSVSERIVTPPSTLDFYSKIYRDKRIDNIREIFYNDYKFLIEYGSYISNLCDLEFIQYSKNTEKALIDLAISLEDRKLNKERSYKFEQEVLLWLENSLKRN